MPTPSEWNDPEYRERLARYARGVQPVPHIDWCSGEGPYMGPGCTCPCPCDWIVPGACERHE